MADLSRIESMAEAIGAGGIHVGTVRLSAMGHVALTVDKDA